MGRVWSNIKHSFEGRSADEVSDRWYGHLQFETVYDGTKFIYTGGRRRPRLRRKQRKSRPKDAASEGVPEELRMDLTPRRDQKGRRVRVPPRPFSPTEPRSCAVCPEPWTYEEDRLLVEKINEMGPSWAAISLSFNRRSAAAVHARWCNHVKLETIDDGTRFIYTGKRINCSDAQQKRNSEREMFQKDGARAVVGNTQMSSVKIVIPFGRSELPVPLLGSDAVNPSTRPENPLDKMNINSKADEFFRLTSLTR
jgi:hypothetical protein